jgi:hypothetical protein
LRLSPEQSLVLPGSSCSKDRAGLWNQVEDKDGFIGRFTFWVDVRKILQAQRYKPVKWLLFPQEPVGRDARWLFLVLLPLPDSVLYDAQPEIHMKVRYPKALRLEQVCPAGGGNKDGPEGQKEMRNPLNGR